MLKSLIKTSVLIATIAASASISKATCLDQSPQNRQELTQAIKSAELEVATAQNMEEIYKDLAKDAGQTARLSKTLGLASAGVLVMFVAPEVWDKYIAYVVGGYLQPIVYMVPAGVMEWKAIRNQLREVGLSEEQINQYQDGLLRARSFGVCSYSKSLEFMDQARQAVMDGPMNGSVWNGIKDHLTLGGVSRDGTLELYQIAVMKRVTLQSKLEELKALNLQ